jgi:LPXTG-motif cell wall-anchored protein
MLNIIANFTLALIATLLVSGVAKWIAGKFTDAARVASFAVGCGYVVGKFSFVKPAGADISNNVAALAGALVALALLLFFLFRKKDHATTH